MANLYPTFEVPTIADSTENTEVVYRPSVFFDFEKGDFCMDGNGRLRAADGQEAWTQWCLKTVLTQRFALLAYTENLGVEMIEAFAEPTRATQQMAMERTIRDALMADPYGRTLYVRDFQWKWITDAVEVTFTVVGQEGQMVTLSATLSGE